MAWVTEGKKSSPGSGTVLADTGAVSAATYSFKLIATSAIVVGTLSFQSRNSTNSSTIIEQIIDVPVGETMTMDIGPIFLDTNERIRVITNAIVLGDVQVSIFFQ